MDIFFRTIIIGLITGSVYALASTGLVLTYKTSGILNFGYGSLAMFATFVHWQLAVRWGLPVWLAAVIVVVVVAPLVGLFLDRQLFSRIQGQPMVIGVIATVGITVLLQGVVFLVWGAETRRVPSIFPAGTFTLPGGIVIGSDQLAVLVVSAGSALALAAVFRFTRLGVAFRAVVDNRPVAGLMAINTGLISGLAWALGTAFAAMTGILLAPETLLDPLYLPFVIISTVLGAAVVGYMRSLPLAYAGGLILGVAQALFIQYWHVPGLLANVKDAVPFLMVAAAVLFAPRALRRPDLGASFVVRTREVAAAASASARLGTGAFVFLGLALVPVLLTSTPTWVSAGTRGMVMAVIFLSMVILTGYSGQISLGHTAFMGTAAYTAAHLVAKVDRFPLVESLLGSWTHVWVAIAIGALAAAAAGALVGVLAVRLHGLFLALMTLGLAFMAHAVFFRDVKVSGGLSGFPLPRPAGFRSDDGLYYLAFIALGFSTILAVNLRTGRTGRVLAAMRDSETASRSLGIPVVKYKVVIFALSATLVGVGAILYSMQLQTIGQNDFFPLISLFYVTLAVVGGIFHVGGALAIGLIFGLFPALFGTTDIFQRIQFVLFGMGATLALAENPEGMFGEMRRGAAAIRRLTGRRRAATVPVAGGQE